MNKIRMNCGRKKCLPTAMLSFCLILPQFCCWTPERVFVECSFPASYSDGFSAPKRNSSSDSGLRLTKRQSTSSQTDLRTTLTRTKILHRLMICSWVQTISSKCYRMRKRNFFTNHVDCEQSLLLLRLTISTSGLTPVSRFNASDDFALARLLVFLDYP